MTDEETATCLAGPHDDHCLREPCRCLREHRRFEILRALRSARTESAARLELLENAIRKVAADEEAFTAQFDPNGDPSPAQMTLARLMGAVGMRP